MQEEWSAVLCEGGPQVMHASPISLSPEISISGALPLPMPE